MIDLASFCGDRESTKDPFTYEDFTYATDGSMIVRIKKFGEFKEDNNLNGAVAKLFNFSTENNPWIDLDSVVLPSLIFCKSCKNGSPVCPECKGLGYVEWETSLHNYSDTCKECYGRGADECPDCGDKSHEDPPVKIGSERFSSRLIYKIKQLPGNVKITVNGEKAAYFIFDGGDGLIMPWRH